jgi:hypothetical protein
VASRLARAGPALLELSHGQHRNRRQPCSSLCLVVLAGKCCSIPAGCFGQLASCPAVFDENSVGRGVSPIGQNGLPEVFDARITHRQSAVGGAGEFAK